MPRGRPKKPPEEQALGLHVTLRQIDRQRLGALMVPGESPSETIRRLIELAYVLRVEQG